MTPLRTVVVYLTRHGDRRRLEGFSRPLDHLSLLGFKQSGATANAHLAEVPVHGAFASEMIRATETALEMLRTLNQQSVTVFQRAPFFVGDFFSGTIGDELDALEVEIGKTGTAGDWLRRWSAGPAARKQLIGGLVGIAEELVALNPGLDKLNAIVGYHAPLCGLAAVDPDEIGPIGNGDIVRYTLTNDGSGWVIASSVHLECPLVQIAA